MPPAWLNLDSAEPIPLSTLLICAFMLGALALRLARRSLAGAIAVAGGLVIFLAAVYLWTAGAAAWSERSLLIVAVVLASLVALAFTAFAGALCGALYVRIFARHRWGHGFWQVETWRSFLGLSK